jgi:hypothetical protein
VSGGTSGGRGWRPAHGLCGVVLLMTPGAARAAGAVEPPPGPAVYIERSACDATPIAQVASILRVELFNRLVEGPPEANGYRAAIDCSGDVVDISVAAPARRTRTLRTNLAPVPVNVRSRIVALAIAELVRDLDREPPPPPPPPPPPAPTTALRAPVLPVAPASIPRQSRAVTLGVFAQASSFRLDGAWLAGGGLRFDYVYRRLCVGLDTAMLTTTEHFDEGTARILLGYGSPYLAWRETWGRVQTRLGAGYALGAASVRGHATEPGAFAGTTTGPWTAPYAFAALGLAVTTGLRVEARGQAGWVTVPVKGEVSGGGGVAIEGLWMSVEVGVALAL